MSAFPKVSIVITTFNNYHFIGTAIRSALEQDYKNIEIIVVDDGSTDQTKDLVDSFSGVTYIFQSNQGLSAARNAGLQYAGGEFICFLDADDWLYYNAISLNAMFLLDDPDLAFVAGAHTIYYEFTGVFVDVIKQPGNNMYNELLGGNFIGMHATVLYRSDILREFIFDTALPNCEDYDVYLRIARKHPIRHHKTIIAAYRKHQENMSGDNIAMLNGIQEVLGRQKYFLKNEDEVKAYVKGIEFNRRYYSEQMASRLKTIHYSKWEIRESKEYYFLKKYFPEIGKELSSYIFKQKKFSVMRNIKRIFFGRKQESNEMIALKNLPLKPVSTQFGYDRGGPIDRYYIETFLAENSFCIHGNILEIGDNYYTMRFGGDRVKTSDVLHVDDTNPAATVIGDLSDLPNVADNTYNAIVLTQTLHLIYDFKRALDTCYRILKPGGSLLVTVPGISHIAQDEWGKYWQWSFTSRSLSRALEDSFINNKPVMKTYGNVFIASAFIYGFGLPEIKPEQLNYHDDHYQVIISAVIKKL
ncbi:glycosyltransferase [Flavihumibacter sp.]|uniref:glycosyltransferase n=1 Tax=Flavihumibacter sp. TaxID=1913981 RepID=UPI002FC77A85